jgi:8-oxo-dGTP pyrophosphatase MutT (NUDIX family)
VLRGSDVVVIVPRKSGPDGRETLSLPKGHPDPGESMLEAATREVREETGIEAEPRDKLGDVTYWYQRDGRRILKKVAFYVFEYRSGVVDDHDDEVLEARWIPLAEAAETLTFRGERAMAVKALSRLQPDQ